MISAQAMTPTRTTAAAALTAMLGLAAGCWVVPVWQMSGMDTGWRLGGSVHLELCGKSKGGSTNDQSPIGTREEWLAASAGLLEREKQLTRMGDELARQRRELPWVPVQKQYTLQTEGGARTLAELFDPNQ